MADTLAAEGLTPQQWDDRFFTEYLQNNPFAALPERSWNTVGATFSRNQVSLWTLSPSF